MDKLTDSDTVKAAKVTPTSDKSALKALSKDKDGTPIRLGDYVMFYDKNNEKLRGIVRWIGTNKSVQPDNTPIVGIEAVSYSQIATYAYVLQSFYGKKIFVNILFLLESFAVYISTYVVHICVVHAV